MPHHVNQRLAGFTLVELSLVMVIIGLVVGGIMVGQSLIRNAELKTILTDKEHYASAAKFFKDKYYALPGDFAEASTFGGTNGNGDGFLDDAAAASVTGEQFQFWRHLQLDGQIEGSFSGLASSGGIYHAIPGTNVPRSTVKNVGWYTRTINFYAGDLYTFAFDYGNFLTAGASTATGWTSGPFLKPEEAWSVDTKVDDGKPGQGNVVAIWWDTCTDAASNGGVTASHRDNANYLLSDSSIQCALYFAKAF